MTCVNKNGDVVLMRGGGVKITGEMVLKWIREVLGIVEEVVEGGWISLREGGGFYNDFLLGVGGIVWMWLF